MGKIIYNGVPYGGSPATRLLPEGGTANQTLIKQSASAGDAAWVSPESARNSLVVPACGTIAPVENGTTAVAYHAAGTYIYRNGALRQVQTAISAGGSIDTNLVPLGTGKTTEVLANKVNELNAKTNLIIYGAPVNSSTPYTLKGNGGYIAAIILGLVANHGSCVLALTKNSTSVLNVQNLMTGTAWSDARLSFAISGNNVIISTNQSDSSVLTIYMRSVP